MSKIHQRSPQTGSEIHISHGRHIVAFIQGDSYRKAGLFMPRI